MDMQMPKPNAPDATQRICRLPACCNIPTLAMAAHAFAEDKELYLGTGTSDLVFKPIDPEQFYSTLLD